VKKSLSGKSCTGKSAFLKRGFSSPKFFYIFEKNELVISIFSKKNADFPLRELKNFPLRIFFIFSKKTNLYFPLRNNSRRGKSAFFGEGKSAFSLILLLIAKTIILSVSGRDPCTGIPVPEIPVQGFPEMQKKGGRAYHLLFGSPPLAKTHWIFFALVPDQKKMEWVFALR